MKAKNLKAKDINGKSGKHSYGLSKYLVTLYDINMFHPGQSQRWIKSFAYNEFFVVKRTFIVRFYVENCHGMINAAYNNNGVYMHKQKVT